jgi:hypothetical protein
MSIQTTGAKKKNAMKTQTPNVSPSVLFMRKKS